VFPRSSLRSADAGSEPRLALLAAVGGAAIAVAFLDFSFWPVAWIAFAPIVMAVSRGGSAWRAARIGLVAGLATNIPAFHWLVETIHVFGGFPLWLSALFYLALSLYSAIEFSLFAVAVHLGGVGPLALYPALFWVVLEFSYPNLFPWRMANCQLQLPVLLQIGELTGPYGLSLVMVWASASVAAAFGGVRRAPRPLAACTVAITGVIAYGIVRMPAVDAAISAAPVIRVGIVQGDLSIEQRGDVRFLEGNLATYRDLTLKLAADADVVIWPESVITQPLPRTLRLLPEGARELLGLRKPLLTGALTYEGSPEDPRFYNSIVLFGADGQLLGMSDKQILMPFGEYLPLGSVFPSLKKLSPETGDFQAGGGVVPLNVPGVARFAPLNCYEDLRSAIARDAVRKAGGEVLFAVANDAWFGNTPAPFQHEALALWRAVENRRFLVRVTNTGVTDVIDPAGRVRLRLPVFEPSSTVAEVRALRVESVYTRFGDWFAWLVTAAAATALLASARSPTRSVLPIPPRSPS
jgi:apolipoprotein N-acyltransferase